MKPYNREESTKSEEVREMFDNIAPAYDRLNHILSMQIDKIWRRRVVKIVNSFNPTSIVDLATGTGDLAIAMATKIESAHVLGVDLSPGMLEVAKEKVSAKGLTGRISLECGAAEHLYIESESRDVVTVAFGVRNFGDLDAGLREMVRTLRSGGHIVVLEFSTPDNWFFAPLYKFYSHKILPFIGGLLSKDRRAYDYLPASVDEFPSPSEFIAKMERAGLVDCYEKSQSFGIARIYVGRKS